LVNVKSSRSFTGPRTVPKRTEGEKKRKKGITAGLKNK